ncbi:LptF/LptG family permease [Synechococcales cyanobacterium C]|uniref:LptF/LptG family permease n=1 Tax=Petrachloros mirabilis ULC683 TaxID=2781853 RepID=A0A8K2A6L8_9CYAN|nr:LptF/LptG family permease [Petrachloros mirabilis]NCJ06169.1 LptF/LptG family permease [Petrachloros mirabilis ULC683]
MTLKAPVSPPSWADPDRVCLRWGILDRYLLKALVPPFCLGVITFATIVLSIGAVSDFLRRVTEQGISVAIALQIMGLEFPSFLVLTLPMAILLACLMAYSRLAHHGEIIALNNCGVSAYRLALPALCLSLGVTLLTFVLSEFVVPTANSEASVLTTQARQQGHPPFREHNIFYHEFQDQRLSRIFYARQFDGEWMRDLTLLRFQAGTLRHILVAEAARWDTQQSNWELRQGTLYALAPDQVTYETIESFASQRLDLPRAPLDLALETREPEAMNILETRRYLQLLVGSGDRQQIRHWRIRLQAKYAFPWICTVFALVGTGLGLKTRQRATAKGFGVSLAIIFGYYTTTLVTTSLGEAGLLSALVAAWLPTLLGLGLGGWLLYRANG